MKYLVPARNERRERCSIPVKELMREMEAEGFPRDHQAQFCSALQAKTFLLEHGLEIERIDGPASKKSTTVVFHYRLGQDGRRGSEAGLKPARDGVDGSREDSGDQTKRLTDRLSALMRDEVAQHGGADGFIRWIRSDEAEAAKVGLEQSGSCRSEHDPLLALRGVLHGAILEGADAFVREIRRDQDAEG